MVARITIMARTWRRFPQISCDRPIAFCPRFATTLDHFLHNIMDI